MPRVIPSGGSDQTAFFLARNAAAEDALARLYMTLLARKEDRDRNEAFQREMLGLKQNFEMDRLDYIYGPRGDDANKPNPFKTGGAQPDPLAVPPTPAAAPAPPAARPGDPPAGGFMPGRNAPPSSDRFSANTPRSPEAALASVMPANMQGADDEDPGALPPGAQLAQGTIPSGMFGQQPKTGYIPPGQRGRNSQEPGTIKLPPPTHTATGRPIRRRPTRGPAEFAEIHPQWLAAMDAAEKKYKLPENSLLTLYGYENGGGRDLGQNGRSSATGLFQFTQDLRKQYGISDADTLNPSVMIEAAARNLRHNADVYKQVSGGKELPTDPQYMPLWITLHQFGAGDGPRMVHAAMNESDHMPAADVMLKLPKRNNQAVLVHNNIPAFASVGDIMKQIAGRMTPWYESSLKLRSPQGGSDDGTQQQAPTTGGNTGSNAPFSQTNTSRSNLQGVHPRLQAIVSEFQQRYPSVQVTSGYRSPQHNRAVGGARFSQHMTGSAFDFSLKGMPDAQRAEAIQFLRARGITGLGNYGGDSFHGDIRRGGPVVWGPSRGGGSIGRTPGWFQRIAADHMAGRAPPPVPTRVATTTVTTPPTRVAAAAPVAARVDKPSEFYVPPELKPAKTAKTTADPSTQFGVPSNQGVIAASLPFGDFAPAGVPSTRRSVDGKLPSVMIPPPMPTPRPPGAPQPVPMPRPRPGEAPQTIPPAFDPEGGGYDYETAVNAGIGPDATGHWPSRDPASGLILKGRGHETFDKTQQGEAEAGMDINKRSNDRYYSTPIPLPPVLAPTNPPTPDAEVAAQLQGQPDTSRDPYTEYTTADRTPVIPPYDPWNITADNDLTQPYSTPQPTPEPAIATAPPLGITPEVARTTPLQVGPGAEAGGGDITPPTAAPPVFNFQQRRQQQNELNAQPPMQGPQLPTSQKLLRAIFGADGKLPSLSTIPPGTDVTEQPTTQSGQPPQVDQLPIDTEGALRTEGAINPSSVPSIQEILQRLQSGATQTHDMQRVFQDAMQKWVQERATGIRDQLFYGPKKVKTQTIASPTPAVVPKPNLSGGGLPIPKQTQPLVLIPNKKESGPSFSGEVVGGPNTIPNTGSAAPPIGTGAPKAGGGGKRRLGIPFTVGPDGIKHYLTPDEEKLPQYQDIMRKWNSGVDDPATIQTTPVVEDQPVE